MGRVRYSLGIVRRSDRYRGRLRGFGGLVGGVSWVRAWSCSYCV